MKLVFGCLFFLAACATSREQNSPLVREGPTAVVARARAPFPPEITDEAQAGVLACEGATTRGQTSLLTHILKKKAASGKPLEQAEIPHIAVQNDVRTLVKNAKVLEKSVKDQACTITLAVDKSDLKAILKEAK